MSKIEAGQTLLFVPSEKRSGDPVWWQVKSVGRKWINFERGSRADKETLSVDGNGYSSPGRMWVNKEDYENEVRRTSSWWKLRSLITDGYGCPEHLGHGDIETCIEILSKAK